MKEIDYRKALESLSSAVVILTAVRDDAGVITDFTWRYVNVVMETIYGKTLDELKQTTLLQANPGLRPFLPTLQDVVDKDLTTTKEVFNPLINKWLLIKYKRYEDGYIAIIDDITEKKQVEERLEQNQKLFNAVFENTGVGIGLVDNNGGLIRANNKICEMLGYTPEELKEKPLKEVYPPGIQDNGWEQYVKLLRKEISFYEIEKQYVRKDGSIFWALLNVSLFEPDNAKPIAIGFVQEIEERKNAELRIQKLNQELVEADKYKDQVLSIVAHDLRSPLSSCIVFFDYLFDEFEKLSKSELQSFLKKLQGKLTNINVLLAELLLWGQNQLNKIPFHLAPIYIEDLIDKVVLRLKDTREEKQIRIITRFEGPKIAMADANMFNAIMRNLLSNAIKFSPENSQIIVHTKQQEQDVLISIIDEGVGMDKQTVEKIKIAKSAYTSYGTKGEKGVGLGLSLCKGFIKKNKGKLYIKSEINAGSTFSFTLPTPEDDAA